MDNKHENTKTEKLNIKEDASSYRMTSDKEKTRPRHGDETRYGTRKVEKMPAKKKSNIIKLFPNVTDMDKHRKIEKGRKKKRLKKQRFKAVLGIVIALILTVVLVFMTPIFNISFIQLDGNKTIQKEIIKEKVGGVIGENLFSVSISDLSTRLKEIPQISDVKIKKKIFPSGLEISIIESQPAAYLRSGNSTLLIDSDLRIVDDASVFDYENFPSISGISVSNGKLNEKLDIKPQEKKDVLIEILKAFEATGIVNDVKYVSIDDLTSITFNYDNRLDVRCGSQLQLDRKIRMFAESLRTSTFDENSIGTIDLSVPGTAVYNP